MSMSSHIVGFRPPDAKWRKMKDAFDACEAADVPIPADVSRFFNHENPDESGVEVPIERTDAVTEYRADMRDGFEIDLTKLPPDVKIIRFFNSY